MKFAMIKIVIKLFKKHASTLFIYKKMIILMYYKGAFL